MEAEKYLTRFLSALLARMLPLNITRNTSVYKKLSLEKISI